MDKTRAAKSQLLLSLLLLLLLKQVMMRTERRLLVTKMRLVMLRFRFVRYFGVAASELESKSLRHVRVETLSLHHGK